MVKILTVLISTISNSQVFLLEKGDTRIFFSKNINVYVIFNDQSFNDTLTNDIVSFEQLGPGCKNLEWYNHVLLYPIYFVRGKCIERDQ